MMAAARTSETSVDSYFTRQYIPEEWRQYAPLKRRSTIILHGNITQKTTLNRLTLIFFVRMANYKAVEIKEINTF
jgi:hypothetical protein